MVQFDPYSPIMEIKNLTKEVSMGTDKLVILQNVTFHVKAGETLGIIGTSGAGKTTLLSILSGLDLPSSGSVVFGDTALGSISEEERTVIRGNYFGFVFQSFYLLENLTALENVMLPLELQKASDSKERAVACLKAVGLLNRLQHYPKQLSGGEQQRVAIARSFVVNPKILFADEPTGNLDEVTGEQMIELLFALNEKFNTTLIIVTHNKSFAQQCKRNIKLSKGKLVDL